MRNRFFALALSVLIFAASEPASAAEPQSGDPCPVANRFIHVGGPENPGAGLLLVCDGANWQRVAEWDNAANLGVKQAAPKAPLHVGGEAIIGVTTGLSCDADREGGIRWNDTDLTFEMCDGTSWSAVGGGLWTDLTGGRIHYGTTNANQVGVGVNDPKAPLHVAGEAIIGTTSGLACDADRKGGLRWSDAESTIEMCDGTTWRKIAATAAATDCTPDAFTFTDLTDQSLNSLILSNTVNITGIDAGCTVSVTGSGSPEISVNGGAWVGATTMNPGDSLQVRQISSNAVSTESIAAVDVGGTTDNWSVTTKAGQTRIFRTANTYRGDALGGLSGADTLCQTEAGNIGLSGTWKAVLSDSSLDAKDRLTITYPVVSTGGGVRDSVNLWDGSLENSIHSFGGCVWSGTNDNGTKNSNTCSDWSAAGGNGRRGTDNSTSSSWISSHTVGCSTTCYLYCVDQ